MLHQLSVRAGLDRISVAISQQKALQTAKKLVREGGVETLAPFERAFVYLPYMRSHEVADHGAFAALYDALEAEVAAFGASEADVLQVLQLLRKSVRRLPPVAL